MDAGGASYLYLNREGRWLDFMRAGVELRADRSLALTGLPIAVDAVAPEVVALPTPSGPSGVAVGPGGVVYYTVPDADALALVDPCDGSLRPAPCVSGPGTGPGQFRTPRGLAFHRGRRSLLVADSANDRVQVLSVPDLHVAEIWAGRSRPVSVACDPQSDVYVVDAGTGQIVKLDMLGRPIPDFWATASEPGTFAAAEVTVTQVGGETRVVVLDDAGNVRVFDAGGHPLEHWPSGAGAPMGLAADSVAVYLGDNAQRSLLAFGIDGQLRGAASGYTAAVAAVALDGHGGLLVHAGGEPPPVRLNLTGAYSRHGIAWGGPFPNPSDTSFPRHLLRVAVALSQTGSQFQLYLCEQPAGAPPPPVDPAAPDPFSDQRWHQLPIAPQATETLFAGRPLDEVWVGMALSGEGADTPVVSQARIDFAHESLLEHLPVVYQRDAVSADLLARWLTIFESEFDRVGSAIDGLARLFDSGAAPPDWLGWLAGWLALELPEAWDADRRRRAIAAAFAGDAWRGTVEGLRAALRDRVGVEATIEEPITQTNWWALPDETSADAASAPSVLGANTVLAVAAPQGAVVGTTAVLDASFLTPQDQYATALFADVAHQFSVRLYRGRSFSEDAVTAAQNLLDEERPAHTSYHLCVVEPRMRVGVQARIGIDAIVAGPSEPTVLDGTGASVLRLGGPTASRLGESTHVGRTYLTNG